jgi:tetratricopeptide (TPR) repeat protein
MSCAIEENLETFSLIWLDASVNDAQENLDAQQQLRTSINFLKTFEDGDVCEKYIRTTAKDDRIVLIISGRLGQIIVPRIHSLRQIISIYVYCKDKKRNEAWANQFKKIKGVIVLLDELISQIRSDQAKRNRKKIDEPFSINIDNPEQSTSDLSGQFIHSQLLIDCLLRMKSNSNDKDELIALCQKYYQGNEMELALLNEFEKFYSPDRALWWYTRETFLYRLMNKAFRVLNIDLLYLLRFFIRDLQQQIEQRQHASLVHLYRCQLMSNEEIRLLRNSIGKYIAMNSYFSTSIHRHQALSFLDYSSDLERVLFEIDADPQLKGIKPFANITSYSYFPEEEEVLFMSGSIFQILRVDCDNEQLWTIRMVLASNEYDDSNSIFNQMKNEHNQQEANILTYGDILRRMGKLNEAEKYYRLFLNQTTKNSQDLANCYHSLGAVACAKEKYNESLQWYLDSLEIKMEIFEPHDPNIATSFNSIAIVHRKKGDYQQAFDLYKKALAIWKKSLGEHHSKVAMCLNNIGAAYEDQKDYSQALEYYEMALLGEKGQQSIDYRGLSAIYNNMGHVYYMLDDYDHALEYYTESYRIKSKFLPNHHPDMALALRNIGMVHEKKGELSKAQEFYKRASNQT